MLVSRTLKDHLVYVDPGASAYDAQDRTRVVRRLRQRAEHLGFEDFRRRRSVSGETAFMKLLSTPRLQ